MKKIYLKSHVLITMIVLLGFTILSPGCKDKDDDPVVQSSAIKVKITLDEKYDVLTPPAKFKEINVTIKNTATGKEYTAVPDEKGIAEFTDLPVDSYDVNAVAIMSAEEYKRLTGYNETEDKTFTHAQAGVTLEPGQTKNISLGLRTNSSVSFVIKTIYYAGSDYFKAAGDNDQFVEIYNNSDEVLYADSLCFSMLFNSRYGNGHPSANKGHYFRTDIENGGHDWSRSEGMPTNINANTDYVYAEFVFMIPGSGKDYPVEPGKSILIAKYAQNFKAGFKKLRWGEVISVTPEKPELTVDLSGADFEMIYKKVTALENPNVPNMVIVHKHNSIEASIERYGKAGYAIFRHPDPASLPKYMRPTDPKRQPGELYVQIPNEILIDAVDNITPNKDGYLSPKVFQPEYDATYTFSEGGKESSQCITRKVAKVTSTGRIILQDLNNSLEDFVSKKAEPRSFANH